MKVLHFDDYEKLACAVAEKLDKIICVDEFNDISIVAKYEEARQIIKELLCIGYNIRSINELEDPAFNGYDSEFLISLANTDDNYEIWCEPMKRKGGYIPDESTIIYVLDNCSSKVIPYCKGHFVYEVSIGKTEKCDYNDTNHSESTHISRAKDGTPEGFTKSWSTIGNGVTCYSSYSHYNNDIDILREIAKKFGVKL